MTQTEIDQLSLEVFREALRNVPRPGVRSIEAAAIMANINGELARINKYIETETKKL